MPSRINYHLQTNALVKVFLNKCISLSFEGETVSFNYYKFLANYTVMRDQQDYSNNGYNIIYKLLVTN